jgi:hypothetical protein
MGTGFVKKAKNPKIILQKAVQHGIIELLVGYPHLKGKKF